MAHATKEDIDTVEEDDPRYQWPGNAKAMAITGLSKRTLENRVRDGSLKYVYDTSGNRHFDPESLNEIAGIVEVSDKALDVDLATSVMGDLRKALSDMTKANSSLLQLATAPAFTASRMIQKENKALRKRCRQLESDRVKAIEAFEQALTEAHERELARKTAEAHQDRLNKGFDALLGQLPNLVNQLSFKKSINKLFGTLTDEQKGLLFEMLTAEQLAELGRVMGQGDSDKDNPKRSPPAKETDSPNGASRKADKQEEGKPS